MILMFKVHGQLAYFDRSIIRSNWNRMNRGPLSRAGAYVRRIARNSIRRRSGKTVSRPGHAPYSHQPGASPPFKMIYHVPYVGGASQIIGMVGFGDAQPAPGIHEHGMTVQKTIIHYPNKGKFRRRLTPSGWKMRPEYEKKTVTINFPERPFMFPALIVAAPALPPMWSGSLGGR